ncbi:MAG: hypothetical protein JWM56_194 [Candidatus Peribacteria bacterium]|nr:hypothetical protein [Candidatus Peribacteria bacterium]
MLPRSLLIAVSVSCMLIAPVASAKTTVETVSTPKDFKEVRRAPGVHLYQRHKDFIHVILPSEGGSIGLLAGDIVEWTEHLTLSRKTIADWWKTASTQHPTTFSITNGEFFDMSYADRAALAFSVKVDDKVISGYADDNEFRNQKLMFVSDGRHNDIVPYNDDPDSLVSRPEPTILVGLSPTSSKSSTVRKGRTFMATDAKGNVYMYSSPGTTQRYATRMLEKFGASADKIMMLDGGGSSYLLSRGNILLPSAPKGSEAYARALPQIIVIKSADPRAQLMGSAVR